MSELSLELEKKERLSEPDGAFRAKFGDKVLKSGPSYLFPISRPENQTLFL